MNLPDWLFLSKKSGFFCSFLWLFIAATLVILKVVGEMKPITGRQLPCVAPTELHEVSQVS